MNKRTKKSGKPNKQLHSKIPLERERESGKREKEKRTGETERYKQTSPKGKDPPTFFFFLLPSLPKTPALALAVADGATFMGFPFSSFPRFSSSVLPTVM